MTINEEMKEKERRARELMEREGLDALAIASIASFAWLTCGGSNHIGIATEVGAATAVITRDAKYVVCNNIEAPRVMDESVDGQGFELISFAWHEDAKDRLISEIANGGRLGSDVPMKGAINISATLEACRRVLTESEVERYKWLGQNAGGSLSLACREIEPGMTEHEIAGVLDKHVYERGITPVLTLIATDERISKYRHPLPTDRKLEKCAMLVTGARKWGLVASATRIVHFGELSPELRAKHDAVARVDAALISATRPGARVGGIFTKGVEAYAETGFADEWNKHHQGGPTGYRARYYLANERTDATVIESEAFAWNPSITGTKTEDTIITTSGAPAIISETDDWPKVQIEIDGTTIARPDILVR